jgi:deoxycytidine triphosphate deaminase
MMLNRDQITSMGLILSGDSGSLKDAGYDLRVGALIGKVADGKSQRSADELYVEPQGIALAVSKEVVKLPPNICAHASVKTSLCRQGVLAINIGIIDPGWEGPISSVMLNFGKESYRLKNGEPFLRLTFHTLDVPANPSLTEPQDRAIYEAQVRQKLDERLAGTFMDFEKAAEKGSQKFAQDVKAALIRWVPIAALALALLTFFLNWGVLSIASRAMPYDMVQLRAQALTQAIQKQTDDLRAENQSMQKRLEAENQSLQKRLNDLKAEVDRLLRKK